MAASQVMRRSGRVATAAAQGASVSFVPPDFWQNFEPPTHIESDLGGETRPATRCRSSSGDKWSHLGPIMGFEVEDTTAGTALSPTLQTAGPMSVTSTPMTAGAQTGTRSMPSAMMMRRSSEASVKSAGPLAASLASPVVNHRLAAGAGTRSVPLSMAGRILPKSQTVSVPESAVQEVVIERRKHQAKTVHFASTLSPEVKVGVIAPGGGTGMNGAVYAKFGRREGITLDILGQSRAPYDRYSEAWAPPSGGPAPNLESFAAELVNQGVLDSLKCLVVGSRGGQVCLPTFWRLKGSEVPPAIVLNGGCGMDLPIQVPWPDSAVTFLMIGGQDYFKQQLTAEQYLKDVQSRVPRNNITTAVLLVHEMTHMPQMQLLDAVIHPMMKAVTSWREDSHAIPTAEFETITAAVSALGFHGKLVYKTGTGDNWSISNADCSVSRTDNQLSVEAATMSTPLAMGGLIKPKLQSLPMPQTATSADASLQRQKRSAKTVHLGAMLSFEERDRKSVV